MSARPTATPEPLSVCTKRVPLPPLGAVAGVHAPRLEIAAHRAGRDLAIGVLAGQPDLDVVGLLRGEAHVAGAQHHGAVGEPEALQHLLGAAVIRSCSAIACSGVVIETSSILLNWCWRIIPRVSRPAEPASERKQGVKRGEAMRQCLFVEDVVAHEIGERHLGRRDAASTRSWCGTGLPRTWATARCR